MGHLVRKKEKKFLILKNTKKWWPLLLVITFQTTLARELDETLITASPIESAKLRHETKGKVKQSLFESFEDKHLILPPSIGRSGVSIRGSRAADRVFHLYKKAPLHIGDGSGPLSDLFGREWLDSYSILKSPSSNLVGNGSLSGSIHLKTKFKDKSQIFFYGDSIGKQELSILHPVFKNKRKTQIGFAHENQHGSYDHKKGLGYEKGRIRNNDFKNYRISLMDQKNWGELKWDTLFLASKKEGENPSINSNPINYFDRDSYFFSTSFEEEYKNFFQVYYLKSDNQNEQTDFSSDLESQKYGFILEKTSYLYNRLILNWGLSFDSLEAKNYYTTGDLDKSKEETETYIHLNYPYKGWMIEPQLRYLHAYSQAIHALHFTKAKYDSTFWLSYSEGFRAPSLYDLFFESSLTLTNPSLEPEESFQVESGFKEDGLELKAFFLEYKNLFQYVEKSGKFQATNLASANVYGLESAYEWESTFHSWKFQMHWQQSDTKGEKKLDLTPELKALLRYSYFWGPAKWSIYTRHWQSYYLSGEKLDPWTTLNLSAETMGFKDFSLKIEYENLLREQITLTKGYPEALDLLSFQFSYLF